MLPGLPVSVTLDPSGLLLPVPDTLDPGGLLFPRTWYSGFRRLTFTSYLILWPQEAYCYLCLVPGVLLLPVRDTLDPGSVLLPVPDTLDPAGLLSPVPDTLDPGGLLSLRTWYSEPQRRTVFLGSRSSPLPPCSLGRSSWSCRHSPVEESGSSPAQFVTKSISLS